MGKRILFAATVAGCALAAGSAGAASTFVAKLTTLNDSGVTGTARAVIDGDFLTITVKAKGLTPDQVHAQHIHGLFDGGGAPIDSKTPTLANDTDGDGFIEVLEGVPSYGDVLLSLSSPPAESPGDIVFPTAPGGVIDFTETYDLTNDALFFSPVTGADFVGADLLPLAFREIVIHGMIAPEGDGVGTPDGEAGDGPLAYIPFLPAAAGEFAAVPLPAPALLFGSAVLGIGLIGRRRRKTA